MEACLDDDAVSALIEGALDAERRAAIVAHVDGCADCRALVADAARATADDAAPEEQVPRVAGMRLGRYVILETVGTGAMGIVYAAYDPDLGRKVALKLLRTDPLAPGSHGGARQRLLREAQALAKLAHPNVIAIHDVGTFESEVFLAMEFVETGTLRDWQRASARTWRATLAMLRQAGEGLAAAHEAQLIHRDFKPDNVLVGADGRARVTDFGLARAEGTREVAAAHEGEAEKKKNEPRDAKLTLTGALVGTPAYMAPERLEGGAGDARSDQFSFCVTLYEALYGERPFAGADIASVARAIVRGEVRAAPVGRSVPAWLRRAVLRGLLVDPAQRFPSMRALLDELAKGPFLRPARVAAAALLLAVVPVVLALRSGTTKPAAPVCDGAEAAWGDAWDAARADVVHETFARSKRASAEFAFREVTRVLGEHRASFLAMHKDACEATRVRGEQSEALLDLRMRCLGDRRKETAALARVLSEADGPAVDRSVSAALSLPSIDACANTRALSSPIPLPESSDARARIDALGDRLAEANALEYSGQYARGLEVAAPTLEEARKIGYAPLVAKLLLVEGRLTMAGKVSSSAGAEPLLHEAAAAAIDAHEDGVAADAWTSLVRVTGLFGGRAPEARTWARYAEAAIVRAGGDDEREATRLRFLMSLAWRREGKLDEARTLIEKARALYERTHGPRYDFQMASCDEGLAGIYFDMARPEDALPIYHRITEVRERLFGPDHPSVAVALVNEGEDLTKLGRAAEAIPLIQRAVQLSASTAEKGGDAYVRQKLAAALRANGDPRAAMEQDQLSIAACARAGETGTFWEAFGLTGLGLDYLALGRPGDAVAPLEKAVAQRAKAVPFELAESRFALARALWETGARVRARALATEAREGLRSDADRYGSWFLTEQRAIDAWLAAHAAR